MTQTQSKILGILAGLFTLLVNAVAFVLYNLVEPPYITINFLIAALSLGTLVGIGGIIANQKWGNRISVFTLILTIIVAAYVTALAFGLIPWVLPAVR